MTAGNKECRRCRWVVFYLLLHMVCVSVTFFVRNVTDIRKYVCMVNEMGNIALGTGKAVDVVFSDGSVHVKKCYLYGRKERLTICGYIQRELSDRGLHERSVQSLVAELRLHAICYRLGIRSKQAVDDGLDIHGDERWVRQSRILPA